MSETIVARYEAALAERGHHPIPLRVTRLVAPDTKRLGQALRAREHDVVLLTSANGVAFVEPAWAAGWSAVAVGVLTANAAAAKGFDVVLVGHRGARAIAEQMLAEMPGVDRVLFLRGREALDTATRTLREAGRTVHEVVAYALDANPDTDRLVREAEDPEAVLVGSPRAADLLFHALTATGRRLDGVPFLALGATTARHLEELGADDVRTAARPGPDGVDALLR